MRMIITAMVTAVALALSGCGGSSGGGDDGGSTGLTDSQAVQYVANALTFDLIAGNNMSEAMIVSDLAPMTVSLYDTTIAWTSSQPTYLTSAGGVNRPAVGSPDVAVTYTAIISKGTASQPKSFSLKILAQTASVPLTYSGSGSEVFHLSDEADAYTLDLDLGASPKDVYFVITNNNDVDSASVWPGIYPQSTIDLGRSLSSTSGSSSFVSVTKNTELGIHGGLRGRPDVTAFNHDANTKNLIADSSRTLAAAVTPITVGMQKTFYMDAESTANTVVATCQKVVDANGKTLNVWVADNTWDSCSKKHCITQNMVDTVASKFLQPGDSNDIHDWVTGIYGEEWEAPVTDGMIADDNNISILLLDIDEDNSDVGGVLGYFYAKDNYTQANYSGSNEMIMFYLDAVMLADPDTDTEWSITDYWPAEIISTLAHEYQHMIHFYQKNVKYDTLEGTDVWINEMCSLMAEDFVADKLGVNGPRGVAYNDGTAGSGSNENGRLPRFNYFNDISLNYWYNGDVSSTGADNVLNSYAIAYAFGAYIARNFGGPELFHNIVDNAYTDEQAIEYAIGADENLTTLLPKWGAAVLLSDEVNATSGYRYNQGEFFTANYNGTTYNYGSIDLYNYIVYQGDIDGGDLVGPWVYSPDYSYNGSYSTTQYRSNTYYRLGTGLTGTVSTEIILLPGYELTVVVK